MGDNSVSMNGFPEETPQNRMDRYKISEDQWRTIELRLAEATPKKERVPPERSDSKLSQYRISVDQWNMLEQGLQSKGVVLGLPPKPRPASGKHDNKVLARQTSEDSGYAKLNHMKITSQSNSKHHNSNKIEFDSVTPDYEKMKKSPHPQRKADSSLQQKIQQKKELSQSLQSLATEAIQDLSPLTIPKDGDLQGFSVDEMSTFFRYMRIEDYIVQRLYRKKLDGAKFSRLKDTDLENIGIKNPIIIHFRDRSSCKKKIPFML